MHVVFRMFRPTTVDDLPGGRADVTDFAERQSEVSQRFGRQRVDDGRGDRTDDSLYPLPDRFVCPGRNLLSDDGMDECGEKVGNDPPFHHTHTVDHFGQPFVLSSEVGELRLPVAEILLHRILFSAQGLFGILRSLRTFVAGISPHDGGHRDRITFEKRFAALFLAVPVGGAVAPCGGGFLVLPERDTQQFALFAQAGEPLRADESGCFPQLGLQGGPQLEILVHSLSAGG